MRRRIAAEYQLDELICSPLQRARQTAAAITAASGIAPEVDVRIREKSAVPGEAGPYRRHRHPWGH